ncbi:MAG: ABC-2 family transporter protein [Planctomycetes bacterium]|nr:ABC-2 family transporter protein [Planctomycetota bacterium]MBI3848512.1 ABC-2 family transporter protein [Planctomycetota bacterium]
MRRYLRIYANFLRFSFSRAMAFRLDFFFRVGMDAIWYAVHLAFFWLIYRHTPLLGGWNFDQVLVFTSGFFFIDAINMTVFANNIWSFPVLVNSGELDAYLVRPVSSLFFISVRDFAANSFLNLIMASGILAWAIARYPGELGVVRVVVYVALLLVGTFLGYVISMLFLVPVFWMHNASGLREIRFAIGTYGERPHQIFHGWVRTVLVTVVPLALCASVPAQVLFEGITPALLLHVVGVTAALFLAFLWIWSRALRAYASASS